MYFNQKKGKLIIISGPSGSGKTTIVKYLLSCNLNLFFSISACSRPKRKNEKDGIDYHFLSVDEFKLKIAEGEFLEWEEVYQDNFYGTLKSEVLNKINLGCNIIFDVDVIGAKSLKSIFKEQALSIYIQAPSVKSISQRLVARQTESESQISFRLDKAKHEVKEKKFFDYILINDKLNIAKQTVLQKAQDFLN
tara:strand:- start:3627 stop:4205 length:579 start_codon:yes stop_codon:yes gene_type:complete